MDILVSTEDHICRIGFNRPDKKNAISASMYQTMADALVAAQANDDVRAILFYGTPECFTAGNDLEEFLKSPPSGNNSPVFQFLHAISTATKPLVAAVAGNAVGIGTTMLMHCDLVFAADNAKFSMPFAKLGLCPEAASSYLFPAIVGYQRAAQYLLTGDSFSANEAQLMGLVNAVVPGGDVVAYATAQATKLVNLPASSVRMTKKFLKAGHAAAINERMHEEGVQFRSMLASPEAREAFAAFMQKRPANFKQFA
jgi:enoyl-CoA hydratase/carnithine racemase